MKLTLKDINDIVTDAQMEAEEIMRNKIVKYINKGYTTNGILFMLGQFNLVTGRKHESRIEIDGYKEGEPIQHFHPITRIHVGDNDVDSDE